MKVSVRIGAREITINHGGREVARHERLHGKFGTSAQLDHYLELLARKPGGLQHSVALAQERDRGAWPDCFDALWAGLTERYGRSDAARQMVDVVLLCRDHGPDHIAMAVRGALTAGAIDGRAVQDLRALLARLLATGLGEAHADACKLLARVTEDGEQTLAALGQLVELLGPPRSAAEQPAPRAAISSASESRRLAAVTAELARRDAETPRARHSAARRRTPVAR